MALPLLLFHCRSHRTSMTPPPFPLNSDSTSCIFRDIRVMGLWHSAPCITNALAEWRGAITVAVGTLAAGVAAGSGVIKFNVHIVTSNNRCNHHIPLCLGHYVCIGADRCLHALFSQLGPMCLSPFVLRDPFVKLCRHLPAWPPGPPLYSTKDRAVRVLAPHFDSLVANY